MKIGELYNEVNLKVEKPDDLFRIVQVGSKIQGYDSKALNEMFSKMVTKNMLKDYGLNQNMTFLK